MRFKSQLSVWKQKISMTSLCYSFQFHYGSESRWIVLVDKSVTSIQTITTAMCKQSNLVINNTKQSQGGSSGVVRWPWTKGLIHLVLHFKNDCHMSKLANKLTPLNQWSSVFVTSIKSTATFLQIRQEHAAVC